MDSWGDYSIMCRDETYSIVTSLVATSYLTKHRYKSERTTGLRYIFV